MTTLFDLVERKDKSDDKALSFLPVKAQGLWEKGYAPSRIDREMGWSIGTCRNMIVEHWAADKVRGRYAGRKL